MSRLTMLLICLLLVLSPAPTGGQQARGRARPIVAGNLTVNPHHIVAVYRPRDQRAVAIIIGRPGQAVQTLFFRDFREAAAVFNDLWSNQQITKDPGDDDARPLTRMMLKDVEGRTPTLIANVDRILAIVSDPNNRAARIYLDTPDPLFPLIDPNTGEERDHLEIESVRDEAEVVVAAYRACVYSRELR